MPKIFSEKDKKVAERMIYEGASVKAIAAKLGVHVTTIYTLRKEMQGGRTNNSASRNVHVRLTDEEFAALDAFIASAGFVSRTAALRSLIRAATGYLELTRSNYLDLKEISHEVRAQGRNLNQLALAINRAALKGQTGFTDEDRALLNAIKASNAAFHGDTQRAFSEVRQLGRDALHTAEAP